jgi:hypothetical protein
MDKKMDGQNNFDLITDHLLIPIFRQASFAKHLSPPIIRYSVSERGVSTDLPAKQSNPNHH